MFRIFRSSRRLSGMAQKKREAAKCRLSGDILYGELFKEILNSVVRNHLFLECVGAGFG